MLIVFMNEGFFFLGQIKYIKILNLFERDIGFVKKKLTMKKELADD